MVFDKYYNCKKLINSNEIFLNFPTVVTRLHYRDYKSNVWSKSENIRQRYKISGTSIYFTEIISMSLDNKMDHL